MCSQSHALAMQARASGVGILWVVEQGECHSKIIADKSAPPLKIFPTAPFYGNRNIANNSVRTNIQVTVSTLSSVPIMIMIINRFLPNS